MEQRSDEAAPAAPAETAPPADAPEPPNDATAQPVPEVTAEAEPAPPATFPVVGIGASAGGLEALAQFLSHVPPKSGMAYVIIQHLDPTHRGAMVELLQRTSAMPVVEVRDLLPIEPDHVYLTPPGKNMSLLHGVLHLSAQESPRGLNLPIDHFFRSLAEDRREASLGVILSGMGSDGTLGLRAIKEKAGAGFVQSINSAKFDGMPRSAIEAGLADVVAPAEDLPARILAYHDHAPYQPRVEDPEEKQHGAIEKIFITLRGRTGNDFSLYKRSTVSRRIERRMGLHQIDRLPDYLRYLRENAGEVDLLFQELLIGVTSFFRDPAFWDSLRDEALPELIGRRSRPLLRAWVPGCSTGEEAYSLVMVFKEAVDRIPAARDFALQVFATDLDKGAIDRARQGLYPANIAADVSPERLNRFFIQDDRGYRVGKAVREAVVFAPQNVLADPPFTKIDIISCRNLLIYLSAELQRKLLPLFHFSLNPGGLLLLGSAETTGSYSSLFQALDGKSRIYRRLDRSLGQSLPEFPSAFSTHSSDDAPIAHEPVKVPSASLQVLIDRIIVQRFAPTAVLITDKGDIVYISGRSGKYLEPAMGKANMNIFAMAREGLRHELTAAVAKAAREEVTVTVHGLRVRTNGDFQAVDLTVQKLEDPGELRGAFVVVFTDVPEVPEARKAAAPSPALHGVEAEARVADLEAQLLQARADAHTTREEMQASQEELRSTNEELQSTNEELQSTNEELTTSKEEMQSMNEELQTVNHELQAKVDDLSRTNNDMRNLLNSTEIATLFLDDDLKVRRFTTQTAKIIKLIPSDSGRPITDITSELDYADLADDAREVLNTLAFREKSVAARDGRWYNVRIMPYRTLENMIDGVVITFADSTASKVLESRLREQESQARHLAEKLPTLDIGCRPDGACDYLGREWVEYTGVPEAEQLGFGWLNQSHPDDARRVDEAWKAALRTGSMMQVEYRFRFKDGTYRWFVMRFIPIRDGSGHVVRWYGTNVDIHDLKVAADARGQAVERLSGILGAIREPVLTLNDSLRITEVNAAAERLLGRTAADLAGKTIAWAFPEAETASVEQHLREALREGQGRAFSAHLGEAAGLASCRVTVVPHGGGLSVLLEQERSEG